jgi:hypothetical protein
MERNKNFFRKIEICQKLLSFCVEKWCYFDCFHSKNKHKEKDQRIKEKCAAGSQHSLVLSVECIVLS